MMGFGASALILGNVADAMFKSSIGWRATYIALGVAILHRLVIDKLLGLEGHDKPKYVHEVAEVVENLENKADEFQLAALVSPATVAQIQELSLVRERMPAKSTYFYPKLITGFVFKPLD